MSDYIQGALAVFAFNSTASVKRASKRTVLNKKGVRALTKVEKYAALNHKYLREADALMEEHDYVQASEKFWGAAATIVKSAAAKRGKNLRSHGSLYGFVAKLKGELNDPELSRLFAAAGALHQNFYENWLPSEVVADYGEAVKQLVEKLEAAME